MTQIPQHQAFSAVTKVTLKGKMTGDMAVMGMIGHSYAYMGLMKTETGNQLVLYSGTVIQKEYEGEAREIREVSFPFENDGAYLKVDVFRNKTYRFFWSGDGIRYTSIGGVYPLRRATWTGAKLCLWSSNNKNVISEGYGEYDFIHIEDRSSCETGL